MQRSSTAKCRPTDSIMLLPCRSTALLLYCSTPSQRTRQKRSGLHLVTELYCDLVRCGHSLSAKLKLSRLRHFETNYHRFMHSTQQKSYSAVRSSGMALSTIPGGVIFSPRTQEYGSPQWCLSPRLPAHPSSASTVSSS